MNLNRKSIRLKNYDYSQNGAYFITICTQNREYLFGNIAVRAGIIPPEMILNDIGTMIHEWWLKIPETFTTVELDIFQIMPNHFHGIINIIGRDNQNIGRDNRAPTRPSPTLGQIIAFFKYQSTKQINQYYVRAGIIPPNTIQKIWQRNYYEHIIRNEDELYRIQEYIQTNPQMWDRDRNNVTPVGVDPRVDPNDSLQVPNF